jgi:AI-2 transport protein TqsA
MTDMAHDRALRAMIALCTAILLAAALYLARSFVAPIAFALFLIALVWPIQKMLQQSRVPAHLALLVTLLITLVTVIALALLVLWGFGRAGQWVIGNGARLQLMYMQHMAWLEERGIVAAALLTEHFDVRWLVRIAQEVTSHLNGIITFTVVTLVFMILGLLEVDVARLQLERLYDKPIAAALLRASAATAAKLRTYMLVRSLNSVVTGLAVWAFATLMGLELAREWGVIAFVLTYIPFIGPLIATLFPTAFAILQFESWKAALLVFLILNLIQFLTGSYIEPRLAGARLAVSPFLTLVAVFFGAFLWGIPGAIIGVPVLIAALTLCEEIPESRWVANLLSGRMPRPR